VTVDGHLAVPPGELGWDLEPGTYRPDDAMTVRCPEHSFKAGS
jgi:hypothetical protein